MRYEYPENAFFNVGTIEDVKKKGRGNRRMNHFDLKILACDKVFFEGECVSRSYSLLMTAKWP